MGSLVVSGSVWVWDVGLKYRVRSFLVYCPGLVF